LNEACSRPRAFRGRGTTGPVNWGIAIMADGIGIERVGTRVYVTGYTYPIKDRLKAIGCHPERGQDGQWRWWIGASKLAQLEAALDAAADGPAGPEDTDRVRLYGKAEYRGRTYYVRALKQDETAARLISLDGKVDFWKEIGDGPDRARIVKRYPARQVGQGRYGRTEYTTLGSLRRFIARQADPATASGRCTECDHWGPVGETCKDCGEGTHV
jgi:hypothetical protein